MSNSITVTVQMDGGTSASQSFAMDDGTGAPPPPMDMGEDANVAARGDAPPPVADEHAASASASGDDAPPPGFEDAPDENAAQEPGDEGDSPPPPDV
ncbi:hypothetical protein [Roseobacter litoralis]|uniref:Uncharacterized protein n=1 Tax=Roseobacter litoralis (strain ATCC 49566 / DSM 6996 / JCM 21268 / NBRC 15278 / OCh 149) TaxID=391595 RepID=F7ZA74_ROSLO|nr:hypothetical protein [Roseobacter litoralis]AEI95421.1 hypothetical protein RLO149_c034800 [Roseobacter litoralis Och 149]